MSPSEAPRHTVLLVDDESPLLRAMALVLRKEPYRVLTAQSAAEALATVRSLPVDVVLSDERMPGMHGTELLIIVRREYPNVIRIMLTGESSLNVSANAIRFGNPYRFLFKPLDPEALKTTLRQALKVRDFSAQRPQLR